MLCRVAQHSYARINMPVRQRNLKTQQPPVILYLLWRKTRAVKSHDHCDVIVFEKLRLKCLPPTLKNESGVFKLLRFEKRFR